MSEKRGQTIDIGQIAVSRGVKLPGFVVKWLKKFFHEDFLNEFLSRGFVGSEFCREAVKYLEVKAEISGREKLDAVPEGAHITIASNHPLGGIDGIVLISLLSERYGDAIRVPVNDFLMNLEGLAPLCIPVNKLGGQARDLRMKIAEAYDSDNEILMFPAGACSRRIDGKIQDYAWKKNFITESVRTGRYVVPVHFIAENSKRFYNVATLCKKLGIKFNIAMFFLPDEAYKGRGKSVKVVIGDPIPASTFDSSRSANEWAQWVRQIVYGL